jgi:hypothetical protein
MSVNYRIGVTRPREIDCPKMGKKSAEGSVRFWALGDFYRKAQKQTYKENKT